MCYFTRKLELVSNILWMIVEHKNNNKQGNIIWFSTQFSQKVSTNIAKRFLDLLDKHFPKNNHLHKIFNRSTVKVSYSCTPNVGSIIESHNKKLINAENKQTKDCSWRKKKEFPLEGKCSSEDMIHKWVVIATGHPRKAYLGPGEGDFKQQ